MKHTSSNLKSEKVYTHGLKKGAYCLGWCLVLRQTEYVLSFRAQDLQFSWRLQYITLAQLLGKNTILWGYKASYAKACQRCWVKSTDSASLAHLVSLQVCSVTVVVVPFGDAPGRRNLLCNLITSSAVRSLLP